MGQVALLVPVVAEVAAEVAGMLPTFFLRELANISAVPVAVVSAF